MYTIIGGDGREYGPVSADQVQAWIAGGRANLETKAKAAGTEEWRRLGDFPDFGGGGGEPPLIAPGPSTPQAPGTPRATRQNLAGRGARLAAVLVDNLIFFLSASPFVVAAIKEVSSREDYSLEWNDLTTIAAGMGLWMLGWLALAFVQIWMLSVRGQTIGKWLLRIRIVRFDGGGNPGFARAFLLRSLLPGIICSIPKLGWVLGLVDICFIFRADHRCVHDLAAGTVVVTVQPAPAGATPMPSP